MDSPTVMRNFVGTLLLLTATLVPTGKSFAHALEPGYLEMRIASPDQYAVLWKVPAVEGRPMAIVAQLPAACEMRVPDQLSWDGTAYVSRWITRCSGGLAGETVRIEGLDLTNTDVLARIEIEKDADVVETLRFTPGQPEATIAGRRSLGQISSTYFQLGLGHILGGLDHLLFVAALLLLVSGWRRLIGTITAFTVAHSITLATSTLGVIAVPVKPIEALIALSIAFVATEVLHQRQGHRSLTSERPWLIAFIFGLLHGFGFASALIEIGLPRTAVPTALLFFNVGVEAGQLLFVACAILVARMLGQITRHFDIRPTPFLRALPPYAIGCTAAFWVLQRVASF
jgi:hydrogenase/urease accessory protein HupE